MFMQCSKKINEVRGTKNPFSIPSPQVGISQVLDTIESVSNGEGEMHSGTSRRPKFTGFKPDPNLINLELYLAGG